jgi:hypothetical protein
MFGPMPASGFFLRHMRNVEMSHVEIANTTPDARPAFYLAMWSARISLLSRLRAMRRGLSHCTM